MAHSLDDMAGAMPTLGPGVTRLCSEARSTAHHRLVLAHLQAARGQVLWVDARDTASTYTLYALAGNHRLLAPIEIARAWTAYQHHTLVRRLVERASPRTRLLVLPNVCSLYRDDDLDEQEASRLLDASMTTLTELAHALEVPVLLTAAPSERGSLEPYTDHELSWRRTDHGDTFTEAGSPPMVYRNSRWWQTTIPYWADLFGVVAAGEDVFDPWPQAMETVQASIAIDG